MQTVARERLLPRSSILTQLSESLMRDVTAAMVNRSPQRRGA